MINKAKCVTTLRSHSTSCVNGAYPWPTHISIDLWSFLHETCQHVRQFNACTTALCRMSAAASAQTLVKGNSIPTSNVLEWARYSRRAMALRQNMARTNVWAIECIVAAYPRSDSLQTILPQTQWSHLHCALQAGRVATYSRAVCGIFREVVERQGCASGRLLWRVSTALRRNQCVAWTSAFLQKRSQDFCTLLEVSC